ncbi:MAG: hypothetical protein AAGC60_17025 [Acidobacteriota bacterium]
MIRPGAARFAAVGLIAAGLVLANPAASAEWSRGERPARAELPAVADALVVKAGVVDPQDDTFGVGPTQIDLLGLEAAVVGDELVITLDFASPPSLPGSGDDALDGFIDLDVDQDGTTGDLPWTDFLRPASGPSALGDTGMGNEAYLDLFSYEAGIAGATIELVDDINESVLGRVPVTFAGSTLEVNVPLALLGDDGAVNVAAIIGTLDEATDLAPNDGSVAADETPVVLLRDGRFQVEVEWLDFEGGRGPGRLVTASEDSALLWFFGPDNWELLVKVLDGCPVTGHYWVFSAATTNVGYTLRVTDTQAGVERVYTNDLGVAAPAVTDTGAFATCP